MKSKLSKSTFIFMLIVAASADLVSFLISIIPIAGQILNPIFSFVVALTLWLWLAIKGLGFRGAFGGGASMVIEVIPILQILPPFTLMVVVIYIKSKVPLKKLASGKVAGSIKSRMSKIPSAQLKKAV